MANLVDLLRMSGGGIQEKAFSAASVLVLIVAIGFFIGILVGIIWFALRWRKYHEINVTIWERDGFGNVTEVKDSGGIFVNKRLNQKRLNLYRTKKSLDCDRIPMIGKHVYLLRLGMGDLRYIRPRIDEEGLVMSVGEQDANWAILEYELSKTRFEKKSWTEYLAYGVIALTSVIILIIFYYFFKRFDVLTEVARALESAAQAVRDAHTGQVVGG